MPRVGAVLFDLDGTLIDSAPDLAGAINDLRSSRALEPLPFATLRPLVGTGARGMVGAAFGLGPGDEGYEALRVEFLQRYEQRMVRHTTVFADMHAVLVALEQRAMPWGIVTNKALRFAGPVTQALGLHPRAAVLVAGDTTPHPKPHPAPLLAAAGHLGIAPAHCVYVGDDLRDIEAGRAAGMATVAAGWGYHGQGAPIDAWGADAVVPSPRELLNWLELA
jgi:phosphoglycolate phosphatase